MNPVRKLQKWLHDRYWADGASLVHSVIWFFMAVALSVLSIIIGITGLFAFDNIWLAFAFLVAPAGIISFWFGLIVFLDSYRHWEYED